MGDMGTAIPLGWAVTDRISSDNGKYHFNLILHEGDVAYGGTGSQWELEEIWDLWSNQVEKIAANVPYMFAVGNHEKYYNYTSYRTRFLMPGKESGGEHNFWYSIDYGNVHFTFMSTEHDYQPGSIQYNWLVNDLERANQNRNKIPWLILNGHRPMYNSDCAEWNSHKPGAGFQKTIEPLMLKYKIDLYLSGHMHMYERIHSVIDGKVVSWGPIYNNPPAPVHVVQATGGVFTDWEYVYPQPEWSAVRNDYIGYAKLHIYNSTFLDYIFIHWDTGAIVDQFSIFKNVF